ncbi:glycoside hydrolase [Pseudovirgaria hyperparasitica]|uniref:glucan 1,3-beta-glucosidase n=1 Tax=Pseudovirgaria hyperparasitica TaxID=470096 RepID=A0A6A6VYL5_9PEZI|nr:glycoside hydrolase [Pseudovirgaria hyperparasitica]KAF2754949.1 glycoside hydrolase [Pseudovirgaria hyperparasitica]
MKQLLVMLVNHILLASVAFRVVQCLPTVSGTDGDRTLSSSIKASSTSSQHVCPSHARPKAVSQARAQSAPHDGVLRGVNIGAWLVLEKWLVPSIFEGTGAKDQCSFDQLPNSLARLEKHWASWFTQQDVEKLASYGFNALRIPIGYWAYDTFDSPYKSGADAWLERALDWAADANMKVLIDLHGAPGSQNAFDNSGCIGVVDWQRPVNLERTSAILHTMARKYGQQRYQNVVMGIQLINEPISWGANDFEKTRSWAKNITQDLLASRVIENPNLKLVMHDAFRDVQEWLEPHRSLNGNATEAKNALFGLDTHLYQVFVPEDKNLIQQQHIEKACRWREKLQAAKKANFPIYVGEWSVATDICVWPDNSTTPGTTCTAVGCQCQSAPVSDWSTALVKEARKFVEAQLDTWHTASDGYFLWNFKADLGAAGPWSLYESIEKGIVPNPIWDRAYPDICSS